MIAPFALSNPLDLLGFLVGGAEGDRTPDLVNAIHALSQLSYGPMSVGKPGQAFVLAARLSRPRRAIAQVGATRLDKTGKASPQMVGPERCGGMPRPGRLLPYQAFPGARRSTGL